MPDRRDSLKIMGAIGATCMFPFGSDELYGQHVHAPAGAAAAYGEPKFFTRAEFAQVSHLADLLIPPTDTPGAVQAGVPDYIDFVVSTNEEWKQLFREGLKAVAGRQVDEALLEKHVDQPGDDLLFRFFRAMKAMTADGYYTSQIGLVQELGYKGNVARAGFPSCEVLEH